MQALKALSLVLPALAATSAAFAVPQLSGSFSTIATSGSFATPSGPHVDVTGTIVPGTFALSSASGAFLPPAGAGFGPGAFLLPPGSIILTFDIVAIGQPVTFTAAPDENSLVKLTDNGVTQSVLLAPAFFDPHVITAVSLTGPEGSLFNSITDPASLHTGEDVSIVSPILLAVVEEGSAELTVTSQSIPITSPVTPVGEPPSWSILAIALIGAIAVRRMQQHG